jgi:hypothetical protein
VPDGNGASIGGGAIDRHRAQDHLRTCCDPVPAATAPLMDLPWWTSGPPDLPHLLGC